MQVGEKVNQKIIKFFLFFLVFSCGVKKNSTDESQEKKNISPIATVNSIVTAAPPTDKKTERFASPSAILDKWAKILVLDKLVNSEIAKEVIFARFRGFFGSEILLERSLGDIKFFTIVHTIAWRSLKSCNLTAEIHLGCRCRSREDASALLGRVSPTLGLSADGLTLNPLIEETMAACSTSPDSALVQILTSSVVLLK